MGNVSPVLCEGQLSVEPKQALKPKIEDEVFSAMLEALLGLINVPNNVLCANKEIPADKEIPINKEIPANMELPNNKEILANKGMLKNMEISANEGMPVSEDLPVSKELPQNVELWANSELPASNQGQSSNELVHSLFGKEEMSLLFEHIFPGFKAKPKLKNEVIAQSEPQSEEELILKPQEKGTKEIIFNLTNVPNDKNSIVQSTIPGIFADQQFTKPAVKAEENLIVKEKEKQTEFLTVNMINEPIEESIAAQPDNDFSSQELFTQVFQKVDVEAVETPKDATIKAENFSKEIPEIVMPKVVKLIENKDGSNDMIIHLEPKELGKIIVKLSSQEGVVSVKFIAHWPVTREMLESGLNNLRQSFVEQGISYDRLEVEIGGQQFEQSDYQQPQQFVWAQIQEQASVKRNGIFDLNAFQEHILPEDHAQTATKTGRYDYLV